MIQSVRTVAQLPEGHVGSVTIAPEDIGTDWPEEFYVCTPAAGYAWDAGRAPVLVLFHEYGGTPEKMLEKTSYHRKAMERGWIVVIPSSAHQYNYAVEYAQRNTMAALEWVMRWYPWADKNRIYALGFSMGGGTAMSFAARNLDPSRPRIAAVVNHTGSTSLRHAYRYVDDAARHQMESDLLFFAAPTVLNFDEYVRSSVVDISESGWVPSSNDLVRNLALSCGGVMNFYAEGDPLEYLRSETLLTHQQLLKYGANRSQLVTGQYFQHGWSTLDENDALNFLDGHSLGVPAEGALHSVLADRSATFLDFDVVQTDVAALSPFRFGRYRAPNRVNLDEIQNISRIQMRSPETLGLSSAQRFEITVDVVDNQPLNLAVEGYPVRPVNVYRNGSVHSFAHNADSGVVTLPEPGTGSYPKWSIEPGGIFMVSWRGEEPTA